MFGRESTMLGELDAVQPLVGSDAESVLSRADALVELTTVTLPRARANTERSQEAQRRRQDRRYAVVPPLQPGMQVFVEVGYMGQRARDKLADRYTGPYRVVRRLPNGNYALQTREGRLLPRSVPRDKLKCGRMGMALTAAEQRDEDVRGSQRDHGGEPELAAEGAAGAAASGTPGASDPPGDDTWEFERVLGARKTRAGTWQYLVQWAGVAADAPDAQQWVAEDDVTDVTTVLPYRGLGDPTADAPAGSQLARRAGGAREG
jgi:hypothetical protein